MQSIAVTIAQQRAHFCQILYLLRQYIFVNIS